MPGTTFPVLKLTPEESDRCTSLPGFNGVFAPREGDYSPRFSSSPRSQHAGIINFNQVCARTGPGAGVMPNSETGGYERFTEVYLGENGTLMTVLRGLGGQGPGFLTTWNNQE